MLGPAPIVDFDGTLARLAIDWDALRTKLQVERIGQLWELGDSDRWLLLTEVEIAAASIADPVPALVEGLTQCRAFAVLTDNSEVAVRRFLDRVGLTHLVTLIAGRETLGGPKSDFAVFSAGFARCRDAMPLAPGHPVVYVGDMEYELAFARRLGANAFHVDAVRTSEPPLPA